MSSLKPVPITNYMYEGYVQNRYTLIQLDVRRTPRAPKNLYDIYLIFRGFVGHYRFEPCLMAEVEFTCPLVSVGGYNSLALKLASNGSLILHQHRKMRVRLCYMNDNGFVKSISVPENSVMPFFREAENSYELEKESWK